MSKKAFIPLEIPLLKNRDNGKSPVRKFRFLKNSNFLTGFTLVEVILTIAIIGILTAVSLPRLGGKDFFAQLRLRTVAHQIASDIRYTRRLAVTNSVDYIIAFDFNKHEYGIYKEKVKPKNLIGEIKEIPSEINLSGRDEFIFQRLGNPASGGTIYLYITSGRPSSRAITVESVTGAVSIRKSAGRWLPKR